MRGAHLIAVLFCAGLALALAPGFSVRAEDQPATPAEPSLTPASPQPFAAPANQPPPAIEPAQPQTNPVLASIRAKLADPSVGKSANEDDLAALEAFYAARTGGPLWVTEMGFSARAQAALFEIGKADDWGLDAAAFELPPAGALPATPEDAGRRRDQARSRHPEICPLCPRRAVKPARVSELLDQAPPVRDPKTGVDRDRRRGRAGSISSVPASQARAVRAPAPGAAQGPGYGTGRAPSPPATTRTSRRLIINMERWRWMPEDLGTRLCVEQFAGVHAVRGQGREDDLTPTRLWSARIGYATPVFTADMATIVFNPDWIAPETVVTENLLPPLREGNYSILKSA